MVFTKNYMNEMIGTVLVLSALLSTASAVDCHGKSFHCVNATHFMICVDLGGGVSQAIENFYIACPPPTICLGTNHFECEFPATTTTSTTISSVISETPLPWEEVVTVSTGNTTKVHSEHYMNTERITTAPEYNVNTDASGDYNATTVSNPIDNNTNTTEIVPTSETVTTAPEYIVNTDASGDYNATTVSNYIDNNTNTTEIVPTLETVTTSPEYIVNTDASGDYNATTVSNPIDSNTNTTETVQTLETVTIAIETITEIINDHQNITGITPDVVNDFTTTAAEIATKTTTERSILPDTKTVAYVEEITPRNVDITSQIITESIITTNTLATESGYIAPTTTEYAKDITTDNTIETDILATNSGYIELTTTEHVKEITPNELLTLEITNQNRNITDIAPDVTNDLTTVGGELAIQTTTERRILPDTKTETLVGDIATTNIDIAAQTVTENIITTDTSANDSAYTAPTPTEYVTDIVPAKTIKTDILTADSGYIVPTTTEQVTKLAPPDNLLQLEITTQSINISGIASDVTNNFTTTAGEIAIQTTTERRIRPDTKSEALVEDIITTNVGISAPTVTENTVTSDTPANDSAYFAPTSTEYSTDILTGTTNKPDVLSADTGYTVATTTEQVTEEKPNILLQSEITTQNRNITPAVTNDFTTNAGEIAIQTTTENRILPDTKTEALVKEITITNTITEDIAIDSGYIAPTTTEHVTEIVPNIIQKLEIASQNRNITDIAPDMANDLTATDGGIGKRRVLPDTKTEAVAEEITTTNVDIITVQTITENIITKDALVTDSSYIAPTTTEYVTDIVNGNLASDSVQLQVPQVMILSQDKSINNVSQKEHSLENTHGTIEKPVTNISHNTTVIHTDESQTTEIINIFPVVSTSTKEILVETTTVPHLPIDNVNQFSSVPGDNQIKEVNATVTENLTPYDYIEIPVSTDVPLRYENDVKGNVSFHKNINEVNQSTGTLAKGVTTEQINTTNEEKLTTDTTLSFATESFTVSSIHFDITTTEDMYPSTISTTQPIQPGIQDKLTTESLSPVGVLTSDSVLPSEGTVRGDTFTTKSAISVTDFPITSTTVSNNDEILFNMPPIVVGNLENDLLSSTRDTNKNSNVILSTKNTILANENPASETSNTKTSPTFDLDNKSNTTTTSTTGRNGTNLNPLASYLINNNPETVNISVANSSVTDIDKNRTSSSIDFISKSKTDQNPQIKPSKIPAVKDSINLNIDTLTPTVGLDVTFNGTKIDSEKNTYNSPPESIDNTLRTFVSNKDSSTFSLSEISDRKPGTQLTSTDKDNADVASPIVPNKLPTQSETKKFEINSHISSETTGVGTTTKGKVNEEADISAMVDILPLPVNNIKGNLPVPNSPHLVSSTVDVVTLVTTESYKPLTIDPIFADNRVQTSINVGDSTTITKIEDAFHTQKGIPSAGTANSVVQTSSVVENKNMVATDRGATLSLNKGLNDRFDVPSQHTQQGETVLNKIATDSNNSNIVSEIKSLETNAALAHNTLSPTPTRTPQESILKANNGLSNSENRTTQTITFSPVYRNSNSTVATDIDPQNISFTTEKVLSTTTNGNVESAQQNNISSFASPKPMQTLPNQASYQSVTNFNSELNNNLGREVPNDAKQSYRCINRIRGRYSDKDDCRKFYICLGNSQPIVGNCPENTVFSELKKLCTKNMSHCIRENEFKCPSVGRFSDLVKTNVYYICVNHKNNLYRFKFQCQKGYVLNKTTVHCVETNEIESNESVSMSITDNNSQTASTSESISNNTNTSSRSNDSKSKNSSKTKKSTEAEEPPEQSEGDEDEVFRCKKAGKFPIHNECRRYYLCKKNGKSEYRRKIKKCDSDQVFHKNKKRCVDAESYEC